MTTQLVTIGEGRAPTSDETLCVGIDLGTTHSVVALAKDQQATVLPLEGAHQGLVPSLLDESLAWIPEPQAGCYHDFKSFMETPQVPLQGVSVRRSATPEALSAALCAHLKRLTEKTLGHPVMNAVLTVPARFSNVARKATKEAAQQAGLNVIRLLNEPTAAALAYGLNHASEGLYLIYDLGGGTFDATLLRLQGEVFQVLATTGDLHLGGHTIDQAIAQTWGANPEDPLALQAARALKEGRPHLSAFPPLSPEALNALIESPVRRTVTIIQKMLAEAQILPSALNGVVLVGGSTRLAQVKAHLAALFGPSKILDTIDPDRAVALGAALHAEALTHHTPRRPLLLDVVPASLGLETVMGYVENIIPKYTPTPISVNIQFSTIYDNQTQVLIHLVQGDDLKVENCTSLGRFILKGIPPLPKGQPRLTISLSVDEDGLLHLEASEATSGAQQALTIESYL